MIPFPLSLVRKAVPLTAMLCVVLAGEARAALLSTVYYSCYSPPGSGTSCQNLPTSSTATNSTISTGDGYGGASGRANYGTITGSGSGSSIYFSNANNYLQSTGEYQGQVDDTLTFLGGTGTLNVTFLINVDGAFGVYGGLDDRDYSSQIKVSVRTGLATIGQIQLNQNYSGSGLIYVYSYGNPNVQWTSADGTFAVNPSGSGYFPRNTSPTSPVSARGTLTAIQQQVQYNTPLSYSFFLNALGAYSALASATATYSILVPTGTTITSASGYNYATYAVPEPTTTAGLLALGGLGITFMRRRVRQGS